MERRITDTLESQIRAFRDTFHQPPPQLSTTPSESDRLAKRYGRPLKTFQDTPVHTNTLASPNTLDTTPSFWNFLPDGKFPDPHNFTYICIQPARLDQTGYPTPCQPDEADFWVVYGKINDKLIPLHHTPTSILTYLVAETLSRQHDIPIEPTPLAE